MRTSYSSLDTFKTCPLKYKFQEIDKIRAPKNIEAVFGSSIHAALKYMFKKSPLYPTLDQVIDFFRETWDQRKATIDSDAYNPETAELYHKQGVSLLENFYKKNQPWNFNVVDLESRFETEIKDEKTGESHILAGIIDRIDKNDDEIYEIIDYKTARKMPGQKELDNDLQLSVYHLGLTKRWPHLDPNKIKLSLYFLKHREKISTTRTREQLKDTQRAILSVISDINDRIRDSYNFPPTPSALCDWCGYRRICPMWK
ncbi:MAG: PD-(D/E)XK nuclease family protein, partial [Patescibacteria group bacterium]